MDFGFSNMKKLGFKISDLLAPLNKEECEQFGNLVDKLRKHEDRSDVVNSALCVMFVDMIHSNHKAELATALSIVANKLVSPPFEGDREILKLTLESIMGAISEVENKRCP